MKVHLISAAIILMYFVGVAVSMYTTVVKTSIGPIRGRILKTARRNVPYASFQGIPYAKSPEGELRFLPPVTIESWSDVFDADHEGSPCIQLHDKNGSLFGSENCLFLNVHSPQTDFTKINENNLKPVMVWIHGGGFKEGSGTAYLQGPDFILEEDVIMVSINYRLGAFGFLNLNNKNASGNMGLKDQNLALKWVKKNIAKFGGDPNKVTIFGQSAGSISVDYHILSDMSADLFDRSISMSGSPLILFFGVQTNAGAYAQAARVASRLASKLIITEEEILKVLKTASARDIVVKTSEDPAMPFRPTIERTFDINNEKFLSKCTVDKYRSGEFNKRPHILGFTSFELKILSEKDIIKLITQGNETLNHASITLNNSALNQLSNPPNIIQNLEQAALTELAHSLSDLLFVTGIDATQKALLRHNQHPIYYYRFSYDSDLPRKVYGQQRDFNSSGVAHADELTYLFYTSPLQLKNDNPEIELTINRFVRLWTNFAKYGNPTPGGQKDDLLNVKWPNSGILGLHLEIDKNLTVGPRPVNINVLINEALGVGSSRILNDCF